MPDDYSITPSPDPAPQPHPAPPAASTGAPGPVPPYATAPPPGSMPPPYPPYPAYAYPYGAPPRKRRSAWFWIAILGGSFALFALIVGGITWSAVHSLTASSDEDDTSGLHSLRNRIAVIDIEGVILDADKVDTQLRKFGDDSSIKAIVLHINSPGGGAAASQEIYHEVLRVRQEDHKRVVASIESVGASGAYYIASACDKIYANDASVVGSIGVIMEWTSYGDLLKWARLKPVVIAHGELKDAGDPSRDPTPREMAYFQGLVDNMFGQFVHDVATARNTSDAKILPLATGQVWTGQQARSLGLIDGVGGYRVALMDTARSVGINGEPNVVRPAKDKKGLAALLNGDVDNLFPNPTQMLDRAPGFYFLWK